MGRIKSTLIKRTSEKLMNSQEFKETFSENKKIIGNTMPSKRIKNMIAGYITKKTREKNKEKIKSN